MTVTATALRLRAGVSTLRGSVAVSGTVRSGTLATRVDLGAITNAASLEKQSFVAPGTWISVFGDELADGTEAVPEPPFPTELAGAQVTLAGRPLPLSYAGKDQLNAQVPYDVNFNIEQQLVVVRTRKATVSVPESLAVAAAQPAIFTVSQTGSGQGVIFRVRGDGSRVIADAASPATAGEEIVVVCAGLGNVSPQIKEGQPAEESPRLRALNSVTLTIGGRQAQVTSAALAPGRVGVYEVGAVVPQGIPTGDEVPVAITAAGQTSKAVSMAAR
jgi:uncharacterized protein (TIGR03437 family)